MTRSVPRASLIQVPRKALPLRANEDRDMNYYATEQLTRQRRDQFVQEASGGQLMANARDAAYSEGARGARGWAIGVRTVSNWSAKAISAAISWLTSRLPEAKPAAADHRAIGPHHT